MKLKTLPPSLPALWIACGTPMESRMPGLSVVRLEPRRQRLAWASLLLGIVIALSLSRVAQSQEDSDVALRAAVKQAMSRGCEYLRRCQNANGSVTVLGGAHSGEHPIGLTSLTVMALINCDVPVQDATVQNALGYLRNLPPRKPRGVYETSLLIMALCAAEEYDIDLPHIRIHTRLLEETQEVRGINSGLWGYDIRGRGVLGSPDRSNGQFALLALRDAAHAGVEVSRDTWQRAHDHWVTGQSRDGGWAYKAGEQNSIGSMTTAGLSTLAITTRMLQDDRDVDAQGRPDCCSIPQPNDAVTRGRQWMANNFSVYTNPRAANWQYYYLYGLERAGRLSNVRFFGQHDWYRAGAKFFVEAQLPAGNWLSQSRAERDGVLNTAMALLFLSKGLSRVVVNKLDYTSPNGQSIEQGEWNRHPLDVINLVDLVDTLPGWPPRLTSQTLTLSRLRANTAVRDMNQAPVLFISGREAPRFTDEQVSWLREYIDEGGFIFAVGNCDGAGFDQGFRDTIKRMFPQGDASLQRLSADHPVFRSEYLLNADGIELHGVDFGCRTSIIYSPDDLGCLWQKWMRHTPRERRPELTQRIIRSTRIGVNVIAYATGREPPEKLDEVARTARATGESIERGLLEIAKLRHQGGWDTAPRAVGNLLMALNDVGVAASTRSEAIPVTLAEMQRFPLVYMHGRYRFQLPDSQRDALRDYISRGGVLLADACCGSSSFDRSFRDLMQQTFPDQQLQPIPPDHEMFTELVGHDVSSVTRRRLIPGERNASLQVREETGPPLLEGIEIDGRYAVIYSRYDISCALEHQASLACDGYVEESAARLAINAVLYAMLQDIRWSNAVTGPQ
jgi:hypothetical protein